MVPYSTPNVNSAASLAALTAALALRLRARLVWLPPLPSLLLFPFTALPLRADGFMLSPAASAPASYTVPPPLHPMAVWPGVSAPVPQGVSATEATPWVVVALTSS